MTLRERLHAAGAMLAATALGTVLMLGSIAHAQTTRADELARGKYIFGATTGCGCHTAKDGPLNAGGYKFEMSFGTVYTPNITPDRETGIGTWTDAQLITAIRSGRRPNGERLIPIHPYASFNGMAAEDLQALVAFLRTVPAVKRANTPNKISLPMFESLMLPAWIAAFMQLETPPAKAPISGVARGEYLVRVVGHCGECHTPRGVSQAMDSSRFLAGNPKGKGPEGAEVPNITPDKETGIGKWTEAQVVEFLGTGNKPDGDTAGGLMERAIKGTSAGFKDLTKADRVAIASYLKTVPPIKNKIGE
jgi:mono/diheme cytochrome c family protein